MKIDKIGFDQEAVVILGAGATRGASFVSGLSGALPPLDSDFFTQAQRLSSGKPEGLVGDLIEMTTKTFGLDFNLTMEGFLTRVEQLSNVFKDYRFQGRPGSNPYQEMRGKFLQVLAAVLDESLERAPRCSHHAAVVEALAPTDAILSFNYDWVVDHTLKTVGGDRWNPRTGYGVNVYIRGSKGKGTQYWAADGKSGKKRYPRSSITLLKMHGAMNWFPVPGDDENKRLELRQRWWHQKGDLQFEIAPPEWNKPIRSGIYKRIWRTARKRVKATKALIFIGYSLPETDLPAQALFMVDADHGAPALDLLVTVNPDPEARRRIRRTLLRRLGHRTRVMSFAYFSDFARFLGDGKEVLVASK